jgi:hypothetical protein
MMKYRKKLHAHTVAGGGANLMLTNSNIAEGKMRRADKIVKLVAVLELFVCDLSHPYNPFDVYYM